MSAPVLVLDWGIGGFGVVKELRRRAPSLSLVYCSDAGFTPYGKVPARALAQRVEQVLRHFARHGVRWAVVACNAASTAVPALSLPPGVSVVDVITPGVALVRAAGVSSVGLVGGVRTVRAGAHRAQLAPFGIKVRARVAQPLSALIEAGELDTPRVIEETARIVAPLANEPALLLACTHYPAIAPVFQRLLPGVRLLDPAEGAAARLLSSIDARGDGSLRTFTTGDPAATARAARLAFGVESGPVTQLPRELGG